MKPPVTRPRPRPFPNVAKKKTVTRELRHKKEVVSRTEESESEPTPSDGVYAYVGMSIERLVALPNYENVRIGISYQLPCAPTAKAMNAARDMIRERLTNDIDEEVSAIS